MRPILTDGSGASLRRPVPSLSMTTIARPRHARPGATYHAALHAAASGRLVRDDADRRALLAAVAGVASARRWTCLAWCLLDTHLHLVAITPDGDLDAGAADVRATYELRFRARHGFGAPLFSPSPVATQVQSERHLLGAIRYVPLNPVAAGVCGAPEDWAWSHHAAALGGGDDGLVDVAALLGLFAAWGGDGRERYAQFVADGVPAARDKARELLAAAQAARSPQLRLG